MENPPLGTRLTSKQVNRVRVRDSANPLNSNARFRFGDLQVISPCRRTMGNGRKNSAPGVQPGNQRAVRLASHLHRRLYEQLKSAEYFTAEPAGIPLKTRNFFKKYGGGLYATNRLHISQIPDPDMASNSLHERLLDAL
jgi:hypothetical protein